MNGHRQTRRGFLKALGLGAAAAAMPRSLRAAARPEPRKPVRQAHDKPNFIIILADDMGYGDASCYKGWIQTPHLDRLAAEGLKFTDFHSSGAVCSPTRAGLMTGRYQERAGIPGVVNADPKVAAHHTGLFPSEVTFPEPLKEAGYTSGLMGKWHLGYGKKFNPMHHGFDRFRGYVSGNIDYVSHYDRMGVYDWWEGLEHVKEEGYSTHLITKNSVKFIEANKDRPFCLYVAHEAVHTPDQAPGDPPQRGPNAVKDRPKRAQKQTYALMMKELDKGIGEIVAKVRRLGLAENTLIFFFSDNGPRTGGSAGPLRGRKGSMYEGGHREPAVAWWPGRIKPGTVSSDLSISLDLMPTMLELAGASAPAGHKLDGISLAAHMLAGKPLGHRKLFWRGQAMRDGQWKLVRNKKSSELYDLSTDLGEKRDLARRHPDRVRQMEAAIEAWKKDVAATATPQPDRQAGGAGRKDRTDKPRRDKTRGRKGKARAAGQSQENT